MVDTVAIVNKRSTHTIEDTELEKDILWGVAVVHVQKQTPYIWKSIDEKKL